MAKASIDVSGELFLRLFEDPGRLRKVLQVICQAAMAQEVAAYVGAEPHEPTGAPAAMGAGPRDNRQLREKRAEAWRVKGGCLVLRRGRVCGPPTMRRKTANKAMAPWLLRRD